MNDCVMRIFEFKMSQNENGYGEDQELKTKETLNFKYTRGNPFLITLDCIQYSMVKLDYVSEDLEDITLHYEHFNKRNIFCLFLQ
jgi:hypothetical protein